MTGTRHPDLFDSDLDGYVVTDEDGTIRSMEDLVRGLEQEHEILQTIMENTHAQLAYLDTDFRFVRANSAYAEGAGYDEEDLIGRNHFDLFPDETNRIIFEHVRDSGQPVAFQARAFSYLDRPELGTTYWDWTLTPVKDGSGHVEGLVLSLVDVTERVRSEATLHRREQAFRALADHAPNAIARFDRNLRHTYVNPAIERATGIPAADFVGKTNCELGMSDEFCTVWDKNIRQVFETGQERTIEYSISSPEGRRYYQSRLAPEFSPDGTVGSVLGISHDISEYQETLAQLEGERARLSAIISDRTRMEEALHERNYELRQLNKLAWELGATLELSQVFERVGEAVCEITGAESSSIWLWDEDHSSWLVRRAVPRRDAEQPLPGMRLRVGEGVVGWVAQHGQSVLVPDTASEPRFLPRLGTLQIRSMLVAPLWRRGAVIGVLEALNKVTGSFDANDRLLLETLTNPAATAIENARLYDQARQTAAEAERRRLARDLHDAVSQTLFSASVIAESLPRIWNRNPDKVRRGLTQLHLLTRGALAEMRALLLELRPTALVDASLNDLLRQLTDAIDSRTRMHVSLVMEGQRSLPPEVQIALYRITQEALNNVIKHARAREVTVHLRNLPERVELRIQDDGRGFDPEAIPAERLGLRIIRERAAAIGAELEIASEAGHGTKIMVMWEDPQ
jgi:PAS domain S-box-containing protein